MIFLKSRKSQADYSSVSLIYRADERSFDVQPDVTGFTSYLLEYVSLEVDQTGRIICIWGYCSPQSWHHAELTPPNAIKGSVSVVSDEPLLRGISRDMPFRKPLTKNSLPKMLSPSNGWLLIKGEVDATEAIAIFDGAIIEIGEHGQFSGLWLHPEDGFDNA